MPSSRRSPGSWCPATSPTRPPPGRTTGPGLPWTCFPLSGANFRCATGPWPAACRCGCTAPRAGHGGARPRVYQLLAYPALDDRLRTRSAGQMPASPVITSDSIAIMWKVYLAGGAADGYVAPARTEELSGLPPTLILTAELDPL